MADIEVKRGYEVLPDSSVRFGIRVINNSSAAILDVEVILDYPESLFNLQDGRIQKLQNIPASKERTAKFILKPLGCVHKEYIDATVKYNDPEHYKKHLLSMRRKEIHCVCPFLHAKSMGTAQFLELSLEGYSAEAGLNFEGVSVDQALSFLMQTCTNRLYKVEERSVEGGKILYLSSESQGEKAYYLLTVLIKEDKGLTQVMLRAVSDKTHGLQGFLNEIVSELKHLVSTVKSAREIGVIKHERVINIIDSVVQRSNFSVDRSLGSVNVHDSVVQRSEIESSSAKVNIQDSVMQRTTIRADNERKREEERLRREREEAEKKSASSIKNSIGMEFVFIPAGEFMMGSDKGEEEVYHLMEGPVHEVRIEKAYYLGKYPVTQKEWVAVMGTNPSRFKGDNNPVERVSWNDAQEFVKKLNAKEGMNRYRLPSEAEWEYACRADTTTRYTFGDISKSGFGIYAWYDGNSYGETHPIGQKKPNPWGLYDMYGNVCEWCQDRWHSDYDGAPSDGSAWENPVKSKPGKKNVFLSKLFGSNEKKVDFGSSRVLRGGGWSSNAKRCRSAFRIRSNYPDRRRDDYGFRLLWEM